MPNHWVTLKAVNNGNIPDKGIGIVEFKLGSVLLKFPFVVVTDCPIELLIGSDCLIHDIDVVYSEQVIKHPFGGTIPFAKQPDLPFKDEVRKFCTSIKFLNDSETYFKTLTRGEIEQHNTMQEEQHKSHVTQSLVAPVHNTRKIKRRKRCRKRQAKQITQVSSSTSTDTHSDSESSTCTSLTSDEESSTDDDKTMYLRVSQHQEIKPRTRAMLEVHKDRKNNKQNYFAMPINSVYSEHRALFPQMLVNAETQYVEVIYPSGKHIRFCRDMNIAKLEPTTDWTVHHFNTNKNTHQIMNINLHEKYPNLEQEISEIKISPELDASDQEQFRNLLRQYRDIFSFHPNELGRLDAVPLWAEMTSNAPVKCRMYKTSHTQDIAIRKHVNEMLEAGIIQPSLSEYFTRHFSHKTSRPDYGRSKNTLCQ